MGFDPRRFQPWMTPANLPSRIDHPGYGLDDAFYRGVGRASAINTCNTWATDMLRLAGVGDEPVESVPAGDRVALSPG